MISSHLTTLYSLELVVNILKRFKKQAREIIASQVHGKIWVVIRQFVVLSFSAIFSTLSSQVYTENRMEHCKYLNARSECNDIVISVYSHYPRDLNAKSSDTKGNTFSIR